MSGFRLPLPATGVRLLKSVSQIVLSLALFFCAAAPLAAQEMPTESKGMDLSAFVGYTSLTPDYGPKRDTGLSLGANLTRYFSHLPFAPSLELRGTFASGPTVNEHTVSGGLRIQKDFRAFHPYFDALAGVGSIIYAVDPIPGYHQDSGPAYSLGGGVGIDLIRNFQLKLDFQHQSWNMGKNSVLVPSGADYTLSPEVITIGVAYRIPFRPHTSQQ